MKQLEMHFGDYSEDAISTIIKNEFDTNDIRIEIDNGDEVTPYKTINIVKNLGRLKEGFDLIKTIGKIYLKEDIMFLFDTFKGDEALEIIRKQAAKIANKEKKGWH